MNLKAYGTRLDGSIGLKIEIYGVSTYSEIPQKFQNFSPTKKYFFEFKKHFAHFFRKKSNDFWRFFENTYVFQKITGNFLNSKIRVQKIPIIFFGKILHFQKKSNIIWFFFEKSVRKNFWTRKNIFLSAKKFEIFVESQNCWKPRKSKFSAQSDFSERNGDHIIP